jgi:hypothetical protein
MSLEMAHKVILPPKKNYIPQFLKQRDINSYFLIFANSLSLPAAFYVHNLLGMPGSSKRIYMEENPRTDTTIFISCIVGMLSRGIFIASSLKIII